MMTMMTMLTMPAAMEEYQECDVILSDVVPLQINPDESSTERDPADP